MKEVNFDTCYRRYFTYLMSRNFSTKLNGNRSRKSTPLTELDLSLAQIRTRSP